MSNVVELRRTIAEGRAEAHAPSLGPAEVVAILDAGVLVELETEDRVEAQLALAYPYRPAVGDEVLVIGNPKGHYVIGVLEGSGKTELVLPGDVDLRAEGGTLRLSSDRRLSLDAPEIDLRSSSLRVVAGAVVESFQSLTKSVRNLFTLRAGSQQTSIEGASVSQAQSTTILSEKKVSINGKEIFLG